MPKTPPLVHQLSRRQFVTASAVTAVGAYVGLRSGLSIAADGTPPPANVTTYSAVLQAAPEGPVGNLVPRSLLQVAEKAKTTPEAYLASVQPELKDRAERYLAGLDETWTYRTRFADQSLEARQGAVDVALALRDDLPDLGPRAPSIAARRHEAGSPDDPLRPPKPMDGDRPWLFALQDVLRFSSSVPLIVEDLQDEDPNPSAIAPEGQ